MFFVYNSHITTFPVFKCRVFWAKNHEEIGEKIEKYIKI